MKPIIWMAETHHQRLGQFIQNAIAYNVIHAGSTNKGDLYYISDVDLLAACMEYSSYIVSLVGQTTGES